MKCENSVYQSLSFVVYRKYACGAGDVVGAYISPDCAMETVQELCWK
jgi:hypothetical protein